MLSRLWAVVMRESAGVSLSEGVRSRLFTLARQVFVEVRLTLNQCSPGSTIDKIVE